MENNLPTSWEEVCQIKGIDPNQLPDVSIYPEKHQDAALATFQWWHTLDVLNIDPETKKVWEPDWSNYSERKHYNWWDMDAEGEVSGFGFSYTHCVLDGTHSNVGSRLVFKDRDTALHAKRHFIDLYRRMMVITKK